MRSHFNVYPRYTAGSPAQVDRATAERVAAEERVAHGHVLAGRCGSAEQERAQRLGLDGIAEEAWEQRGKLQFRDLITGEAGPKLHRAKGH